jgi:hypothetical protein
MKFMLTLVIVCCAFFAKAQHTFDWSKYNSLPFVEDKEPAFPFWSFEKDVLSPIKESKADMEIRCYYFQHVGHRTIFTMQCFGDSLVCKILNRRINVNAPIPVSKEDSVLYENGGNYYSWHTDELVVNKKIRFVMDELMQKGLFTLNIASVDSIKEVLRRKHACEPAVRYNFSDRYHAYFLIKINNRYRSFITRYIEYYDEKINQESFHLGGELLNAFRSFFNEEMIARTYDIECRSIEN